jgi:hypothetical protein
MRLDDEQRYTCGLTGTNYRGEAHSIWFRIRGGDGYQAVDLDLPGVYEQYLAPSGVRIPIFPLISVLYSLAPLDTYPVRRRIGIPDFATDFGFSLDQVEILFDCDPAAPDNESMIAAANLTLAGRVDQLPPALPSALPLPELGEAALLNTGLGAELAVAADLERQGWHVQYTGNQPGFGYDLIAEREEVFLRIEVKSSIGFTTPELTASEWSAAQDYTEDYILAIVDFYGTDRQIIWYVRDPAVAGPPRERVFTVYRFPRETIEDLRTEVDFL